METPSQCENQEETPSQREICDLIHDALFWRQSPLSTPFFQLRSPLSKFLAPLCPKEDSQVSEATRRAVQEEAKRLILQKIPLQKKLFEIMFKYSLKGVSNDVERCLSLVSKEEDDKMRTNAANVAAGAAVRGDDMLSKWQLMAEQAR
ncbi:hypothetical protein AHAS_Ahas13G0361100 [Arachis hypogaea]